MDDQRFDQLIRVFGSKMPRRTGVLAAIGAVIGLGVADETDAARGSGRRHEKLACRNANSECTSNEECCSNVCKPKFGGTGFRCAKAHGKKKDKGGKKGGGPALIPTGAPCGPGDTCANALASCTTYTFGTPEGTYCLLPAGAACDSDSWCEFDVCDHGTCAATCTVCASGCPHTTIEGAVANALPGDKITVAPGTYMVEPISPDSYAMVPIRTSLTIRACNPNERPVIDSTSSASNRFIFSIADHAGSIWDACADDQPIVVFDGLDFQGSVTMEGRGAVIMSCSSDVTIRNSAVHDFGTIYGWPPIMIRQDSHLLIDNSTIQDNGHNLSNVSAIYVFRGTSDCLLEVRDSVISGNVGSQSAIFVGHSGTVHLSGTTQVKFNASSQAGAGISMGLSSSVGTVLTIDSTAAVTQNASSTDAGGVYADPSVVINGVTPSTVYANTAGNFCPNFLQGTTCVIP